MPEPRCRQLRAVIESFAGKRKIFFLEFRNDLYNIILYFPFRSQALLRQDDTNGRFAEAFTFEMRDMQGKDSTFETNPHPTGRK